MSLTYRGTGRGAGFGAAPLAWTLAAAASVGLHLALPAQLLSQPPAPPPEAREETGVTGAVLFDLSDIIAAPAETGEDSAETVESRAAPTVTESADHVEPARAAEEPLLSQIPYDVADESLKFGVASPEPAEETEDLAEETATEVDPEQVEAPSQRGAEAAQAAQASVSGVAAEQQAETAKAQSEGLTAEQKQEILDWQRDVVLAISKAKRYPPQARRQRIEGEVSVRFTLDSYGSLLSAEIASSSGADVLDRAALAVLEELGKLPTPPNHLSGEAFTLIIPLRYRFR